MTHRTAARQLNRARAFLTRAIRHPTWAAANVRSFMDKRSEPSSNITPTSVDTVSLQEALRLVSGAAPDDVLQALAAVPRPRLRKTSVLYGTPDGSNELVTLAYAICRLTKPKTVVETGVANGFTTAGILHALHDNGHGQLLSIDLPHLHPKAEESIGAAVDTELRDRWKLHFGPADRLLPQVLSEVGQVDMFVQDAAHTVRGQLAEYRAGWPFLRTGGVLISDDIGPGFMAFAKEVKHDPVYVGQDKPAPIGILMKGQ